MANLKSSHIKLVLLFENGITNPNELAARTGMGLRSVSRNLTKLRKGESLERRPGSGRNRLITGPDKTSLTLIARQNPEFSAKDIQKELRDRGRPNISVRTIQRSLMSSGYSKKKPADIPDLTDLQNEKRVTRFAVACEQSRLVAD